MLSEFQTQQTQGMIYFKLFTSGKKGSEIRDVQSR